MADTMETLHAIWRTTHVVAGVVGLVVFWLPIFARKGKRLHVSAGKVFALCAWIVGITAVGSALGALAWPAAFAGNATLSTTGTFQVRALFGALLGFLGLALLQATYLGLRIIATKQAPEGLASISGRALTASLCLWGLGMAGYGIYLGTAVKGMTGLATALMVLGSIGCLSAVADWRFLSRPRPTKMAWWYKHMECMIGCGIAFHTAFLVFGMNRLIGMDGFAGGWALLGWLLPSAIGVPALVFWTRYYKQKFGEWGNNRAPLLARDSIRTP